MSDQTTHTAPETINRAPIVDALRCDACKPIRLVDLSGVDPPRLLHQITCPSLTATKGPARG